MKKKPRVKYVSWGIANTFDNNKERWIELNKNLKRYPRLKKEILKHELKHYYSKNRFDFIIEVNDMFNFKKQRELSSFSRENPSAYAQLIPFIWNKKGFFPDYFMLSYYSIIGTILVIIIKIIM